MVGRFWGVVLIYAAVVVLEARPATSLERPPCPAAPPLEATTTSTETKTALDAIKKIIGSIGLTINVRTTRDSVLKDNPRADQVVVVLTMANTVCNMIWSDSGLSGEDKAERYTKMMKDLLTRASGPEPIGRTGGRGEIRRSLIVLVSFDLLALSLAAENPPELELPQRQTGFLRDRPFYVNNYNKYFVIVGSALTREEGLKEIKRLKAKAPQYDFELYAPYGDNPHYGIMMASWVPRDVAMEALRLARRYVARDANLWACRSSGDSC